MDGRWTAPMYLTSGQSYTLSVTNPANGSAAVTTLNITV
jgi:hypothetical protein